MLVPKASDVLADELRERILSGDFAEGTSLPPERELVDQTGMSRTTVREALRILEVQNLVSVRTGRLGGAYVTRPDTNAMESAISLLIRGGRLPHDDLLEIREGIEPVCAALAAKYRDNDDIALLTAANHAIEDPDSTLPEFLAANVEWHVGVAASTHNSLLSGFMSALSRAIYEETDDGAFVNDDIRRDTARAHLAVTAAIGDGDAELAQRRMSAHVHAYAQALRVPGT